tara:strand:+ start:1642 stop:2343 length:702 start_codon:yes stop_codon:yes gene_type:complete
VKKPEIPANEPERLQCLLSTGLLDTQPEERFDRITRIAQHYFKVPITYVSLVDANRQWFKSKQGIDVTETPRDISFCGHAILGENVFLISDAKADERFADNPLVTGPPNIRFYAGLPLHGHDGHKIGTLCFVDSKPRDVDDDDIAAMRDLADCVEAELKIIHQDQVIVKLRDREIRMRAILDALGDGELVIEKDGTVASMSPLVEATLGLSAKEMVGQNASILLPIDLETPYE